jgi:hypothetical protein
MSALLAAINQARNDHAPRQEILKTPSGRSRYRILPSWRGEDQQCWIDFAQHFVKDSAGKVKAVYVCDEKTFGRPCDVCQAIDHGIVHSTDDLTKSRLEEARAGGQVLINVLHLDGPTPNKVQTLGLTPGTFYGKKGVGGVLGSFQDWTNLFDGATGADMIIDKSGAGKEGTVYSVSIVPGKPIDKALYEGKLIDLDKLVARENDKSKLRAIASVSAISGVPALGVASAPRLAHSVPTPSASSYTIEEDELRELEQRGRTAAAAPSGPDLEAMLKDL